MMKAGVPLVQGFEIVAEAWKTRLCVKLSSALKVKLKVAIPLLEHSKISAIFPNLFLFIVESGEQSGALETMLDRWQSIKKKVNC